MTRPVGVAVIGCGRISASHLEAIQSLPECGHLVAVVDADLERARAAAAAYQAPHAFAELRAVFELDAVEAVCICTPNAVHEEQALLALAAGRHVLLEKPMAETLAGAECLAAAADRSGLILAVGHTFRHSEPNRYLQAHRNDYGLLRAIQVSICVHWDGPQAPWWRDRSARQGLILSLLAPHALDFLQLVMGKEEPLRVSVEAARHQSDWQAEDEAMILLRYPEDCMVFVHLSYNQRRVLDRKTLHFDRAMLCIEDGERLWVDDALVVDGAHSSEHRRHRTGGRDLRRYFRAQFEEFSRAVRGETSRSVLQHDALRVTALTQRILQAVQPIPEPAATV